MPGDPVQSGNNSGRWGGPHQKNGIDAMQALIERIGKGEISAHHFDLWRKTGRIRFARHCADLRARARQLRDNLAPDIASGSDNEDSIHTAQAQALKFSQSVTTTVIS